MNNESFDKVNTVFFISEDEFLTCSLLDYLENMDDSSKIKESLSCGLCKNKYKNIFTIIVFEELPFENVVIDFIYGNYKSSNLLWLLSYKQSLFSFYLDKYIYKIRFQSISYSLSMHYLLRQNQ